MQNTPLIRPAYATELNETVFFSAVGSDDVIFLKVNSTK